MKITIKVEPREDDSTNNCSSDPVAQALRVAVGLPRCTAATASRFAAFAQPSRLYARGPKGQILCETPKEVRDWIMAWDNNAPTEPVSFDVDMVPQFQVSNEYIMPGTGLYGKQ